MTGIRTGLRTILPAILLYASASADVILPDHHPVSRCVTFDSLELFPDVVLIGVYRGPMVETFESYVVETVVYIFLLGLSFRRAAVLSCAANAVSVIIGLVVLNPF